MSQSKSRAKLKALAIENLFELPLFMPTDYSDYTRIVTDFDIRYLSHGQCYVFEAFLAKDPSTKFKNKKPQTTFHITDRHRQYLLMFTIFGDTRELITQFPKEGNAPFYVFGELSLEQGAFINNASILPLQKVGTIEPIYPGVTGKVKPETVRNIIFESLSETIKPAAERLRELLMKNFQSSNHLRNYLGVQSMTLEQILYAVHAPQTIDQAKYALQVMKRIGTLTAATELIQLAKAAKTPKTVKPIHGQRVDSLVKSIPFPLTGEQRGIVDRVIEQFYLGEQLEGRLVRHGGEGWCSLFVPMPIKNPATQKRLQVLTQTTDGHLIAKMDLVMRGCGDIVNGKTQHGSYQGLVRNVDVDIDVLENTLELLT